MTATTRAGSATIERLRDALLGNALPGELDGFTHDEQVEAASFIADVAATRRRGELALRLEFDRRRGRPPADADGDHQ